MKTRTQKELMEALQKQFSYMTFKEMLDHAIVVQWKGFVFILDVATQELQYQRGHGDDYKQAFNEAAKDIHSFLGS